MGLGKPQNDSNAPFGVDQRGRMISSAFLPRRTKGALLIVFGKTHSPSLSIEEYGKVEQKDHSLKISGFSAFVTQCHTSLVWQPQTSV